MKKIISILFLLFSFYIFSIIPTGNANSNSTTNNINYVSNTEIELEKKLVDLENEVRIKNLIQYIEFESEIIVPNYIDIKYIEYIYSTADTLKIPTRVAFRLVYRESSFRDTVASPAGAHGLMQLMPDTKEMYQNLLRTDTLNLDKNQEDIYIGMNYLKDLYEFWKNKGNSEKVSWRLCLASYNAGKGAVIKYWGIPPYKETSDFVNFIYKAHSNPEFFANYAKKYENEIKSHS
jgi:hypothetical protein